VVGDLGGGLVVLAAQGDPPRAAAAVRAIQAAADKRRNGSNGPPATPLERAVAEAKVDFAEEDYVLRTEAMASECTLAGGCPGMWGMTKIKTPQAWSLVASGVAPASATVVGSVIDTGVQYSHVELDTQMVVSLGATYFNNTVVGNGSDDNGHGTHCAGTMAAKWGGALGTVAGVNGAAKVVSCKFLSARGSGYTSDAIQCINAVVAKRAHSVINNSWAGGGFSNALLTTIRAACAAGSLFVAAAGNSAIDISAGNGTYPAYYAASPGAECVLPVAAVDQNLALASFSNYGAAVPIAAPGVGIRSSLWSNASVSAEATWSGTSMAAPHVSGVALLLRNQFPALTGAQIKGVLVSTAPKIVLPFNGTRVFAGGFLDAEAAYKAAAAMAGAAPVAPPLPPPPPPPSPSPLPPPPPKCSCAYRSGYCPVCSSTGACSYRRKISGVPCA
jgi:subtilisin family serine protease